MSIHVDASPAASFLGGQGQGKSAAMLAQLIQRKPDYAYIIDPVQGLPANLYIDNNMEDLREALKDIAKRINATEEGEESGETYVLSFAPATETAKEASRIIADHVKAYGGLYIIDEAHRVVPVTDRSNPIIDIAKRGRHYGAAVWVGSQRPADVSRDITAGSERFMFWHDEARDLAYIREVLGPGGVDIVEKLKPLEYLYKHNRTGYLGRIVFEKDTPVCMKVKDIDLGGLRG